MLPQVFFINVYGANKENRKTKKHKRVNRMRESKRKEERIREIEENKNSIINTKEYKRK